MQRNLRLVSNDEGLTADTLFVSAIDPLPTDPSPEMILTRAAVLAEQTLALIRREQEPAILASVALVIPDQALKVAYLEAIGAALL